MGIFVTPTTGYWQRLMVTLCVTPITQSWAISTMTVLSGTATSPSWAESVVMVLSGIPITV